MSKGVVGRELLDDSVVAMEAVVASSKEGGVHGSSLPGGGSRGAVGGVRQKYNVLINASPRCMG